MSFMSVIMTSMYRIGSKATLAGCFALMLWSTSGILVANLKQLPVFEVLTLAFITCFLLSSSWITLRNEWPQVRQPLKLWIIGVTGVCGCDFLFISAFHYAPAAHVDLINYLWPVFMIIFASFIPGERVKLQHIIACGFGFYGIYILLTQRLGIQSIPSDYLPGYGLALLEAIIWSLYAISLRYYRQTHILNVGLYCGFGAILSFICHMQFETFVVPSFQQFGLILYMGLATQGLAFISWAYGIRHGNYSLLAVMSYFTPLVSVALLVAFGFTPSSSVLWISSTLIVFAFALASYEPKSSLNTVTAK